MLKRVIFLVLFFQIALLSQENTIKKVIFFIDHANLLYTKDNEIKACSLDWKFGFLNEETGCIEVGLNKELLSDVENFLLDTLNKDNNIKFKIDIEAGDTISNNVVSKIKNTVSKSITKRTFVFPGEISGIDDIKDYGAYKIKVSIENYDQLVYQFKNKTIKVIPVNQIAGYPGKNEIWFPLHLSIKEEPVNSVLIFSSTITQPGWFKAFFTKQVSPLFNKGGVIAYILTFLGILGIFLFIYYLSMFKSTNFISEKMDDDLLSEWMKFFEQPTKDNLYNLLLKQKGLSSKTNAIEKIFYNILFKHMRYKSHWSKFLQVHNTLDEQILLESESKKIVNFRFKIVKWLENFFTLEYFWNIGSIAPMLGLLGTVIGISQAFNQVAQNPDVPKEVLIKSLSNGINTALYTTIFGLSLGIPMMLAYYILKNKLDKEIFDLLNQFNHFFFLKDIKNENKEK